MEIAAAKTEEAEDAEVEAEAKPTRKKLELKFQINGGSGSFATYAAVKEKLVMRLQTKYGPRVAETICTGIEYDFDKERPTLAALKAEDAENRELENEANMIIYKAEANDWVSQKQK